MNGARAWDSQGYPSGPPGYASASQGYASGPPGYAPSGNGYAPAAPRLDSRPLGHGAGPGRRSAARSTSATQGRSDRLLAGAPAWLPPAATLGGPILAALLGKFVGGYHGPVFCVLTVALAGLATAAATANGRWWVVTAVPPVAWLVASVAELAWHDPAYPDTKAKAVGLVHATTNVFPVILAALAVMGLVIVAATLRGRQPRRGGGARHV